MNRVIQTYDPGGTDENTTESSITKNTINSILQRKNPINVGLIRSNTVGIPDQFALNLSFYFENNSESVESEVTMCILDMPGKTIILGLPDIIQSYYYLFIEMVSNAKVEHHEAARLKEEAELEHLQRLDLQLPIQGLEKPYKPWKDTPWVIAEEELETPDPCSFTGPFAYLTMTHE